MKYKGYLVETADSKPELRKMVEDLMEEGWVPLGGVSIACDLNGTLIYCQAMVLPE